MPSLIVSTPGAANANAFCDEAWGNSYHQTRPNSDFWFDQSTEAKEAGIIQATRFLCSAFQWTGAAASGTQSLCWPRTGMLTRNGYAIAANIIPVELKDATAEFARQLIEADRAADNDAEKTGLSSVSAGPVSVSWKNREDINTYLDAKRTAAWASPLIPDAVLALLVDSWYLRPTVLEKGVSPSMIFKAW